MASSATSLASFHECLSNYHETRRKWEKGLKKSPQTLEKIWENMYGNTLLEMLTKQDKVYHVIAIGTHASALMDIHWFDWYKVSCECICPKVKKGHVHMIGRCTASRGVRERFFRNLNESLGLKAQERSSKFQRFIELKDFQHLVTCFVYITREQAYYNKSAMETRCKHSNFLPYGLNKYSEFRADKDFMPGLWNIIYSFLADHGYRKEVDEAREKYETYKANQQNRALQKRTNNKITNAVRKRNRTDDSEVGPDEKIIRLGSVPFRAELLETDTTLMGLIKDDPNLGISLCDAATARRIICFLRQHPTEIVGGLREFVIKAGPKEEDSCVSGAIQFGKEFLSQESDPEDLDNGND